MSYQKKLDDHFDVVECDVCGRWGPVRDRNWRAMRQSQHGTPIHLCCDCRPLAVWCQTHDTYHLPEILHRTPCIVCGGLYTSKVEQQIEHCPQCRRTQTRLTEQTPAAPGNNLFNSLRAVFQPRHIGVRRH